MSLGVHSEVGTLRRVHGAPARPRALTTHAGQRRGAPLRRRAVGGAGQAGARCVLRSDARARRRGLRGRDVCSPRRSTTPPPGTGSSSTSSTNARSASAPPSAPVSGSRDRRRTEVADFLIGGITREDVRAGPRPGVGVQRPHRDVAAAAAELPVPAGPVVLDLRRRHDQPDDEAGRKPESMIMEAIYRFHPHVQRPRTSRSGSAARTRTGGAATSRAATCSRSATARS